MSAPTGYEKTMYGDITTIARNSGRIADALEEIAAQNRDPEVTRARNLAALDREQALAGEIPAPHGILDKRAEREATPECVVNRCTRPALVGRRGCDLHGDR